MLGPLGLLICGQLCGRISKRHITPEARPTAELLEHIPEMADLDQVVTVVTDRRFTLTDTADAIRYMKPRTPAAR